MAQISQKKLLLEHLKKYGSIEPLQALREYGMYRLGARISDLKKDGWNIITERIKAKSSITGNFVSFAKYRLEQ